MATTAMLTAKRRKWGGMAMVRGDGELRGPVRRALARVNIGEDIDVRMGVVGSMVEIDPLLASGGVPRNGAGLTIILVLPRGTIPAEAMQTLKRWDSVGHTLVFTSTDSDGLPLHAVSPEAPRGAGHAGGAGRVLIEPDAARAVIGSLQTVHTGDMLRIVAVGVSERDVAALRWAVVCGIGWRAAWDEPENGEFHMSARGPDGAPVLPGALAAGGCEQGGSS